MLASNTLTIVVPVDAAADEEDKLLERRYLSRTIRISGTVTEYKGQAQIRVKGVGDLEVITRRVDHEAEP
jgi:hypothetical protein